MSFKVIRATVPELAVQMVGGAHPTRPRMASLWGLRMRSTIGKMSKLQLLLRNTGNELPVPPMVYVHEPTALVVRTLYVSRSCVYRLFGTVVGKSCRYLSHLFQAPSRILNNSPKASITSGSSPYFPRRRLMVLPIFSSISRFIRIGASSSGGILPSLASFG
jgi:hypothetical protein